MLAKASAAYDKGITGRGVTIAVIDTGVNRSTPEFAGRVSADSTGFEQGVARCGTCAPETVAPYPIDDRQGHGTEVASITLAARNGTGPQGLAPDATLLALKIVAADLSGQTASSTGSIPESGNDLTPGAREFDLSVGWAADLSRSASLRLGVAHALAAGHVAGASDTDGFFTLSIR